MKNGGAFLFYVNVCQRVNRFNATMYYPNVGYMVGFWGYHVTNGIKGMHGIKDRSSV